MSELVGEPATQQVTVAELAGRLGHHPEAAFSRAGTRVLGIAPGAARRRTARVAA